MNDNIDMENIIPLSNRNQDMSVNRVVLNKTSTLVDVYFKGLGGDKYTIKFSDNTLNNLLTKQEVTYYTASPVGMQVNLVKGVEYDVTLFDSQDMPVDVFTFIAPETFEFKEQVIVKQDVVSIVSQEPKPLDKTGNEASFLYTHVLVVIILCLVVFRLIRQKGIQ